MKQITVKCVICGKEYMTNENYRYRIANQKGLLYCSKECTWSEKAKKLRYKISTDLYFKKTGVDNPFKLGSVKEKIKVNRNDEKRKETRKNTLLKRYGVDNIRKIAGVTERIKITNLERYGNVVSANCPEIQEKIKKDTLEKHGVEYYFQSKEFLEKFNKIMLEKYGELRPYSFGSNKYKKILFDKYGVENCMQISGIAHKNFLSGTKKKKSYILPSGKIAYIQGYEPRTFDKLLKFGYKEDEIKYKRTEVPKIWYIFKNKKHRYYPDFYIPKDNLIIETKSTYTLLFEKEKNDMKFRAVKAAGYNFRLDIYGE